MQRARAIERLRTFEPRFRALGATSLFLYGSTARDEATSGSDIDLFIDFDPKSRFNAFDLVDAKEMVEDELGLAVDMTTRGGLHRRLVATILAEAVRVF